MRLILPGVILLMAVVTGLVEPRFWSIENLINLSRQISPLLIVSVGQAVAVLSGGLDLSIAATLALSSMWRHDNEPRWHRRGDRRHDRYGDRMRSRERPDHNALSGLSFYRDAWHAVRRPRIGSYCLGWFANLPSSDSFIDARQLGQILGIPVGAVIAVATLIGGALLLRFTIFGRYVYAIGSSTAAAFHSGVNVRLYVLLVYAFAGLTAGLAAIVLTAWVAAAQPLAAQGLELQSLGAVVIGGIALTGGSGSLLNMCYGVLILGMLSNSLNMIGMSSFMQTLTIGVVIVAAVVLDKLRRA